MAGSIYDRMMATPQYDSNAGTSALNSAANAFQGMASTFNTMRQSIIDEEQKNLQREMEKQHHREEMDYKDRSLAQDYKQHSERLDFDRLKHADDMSMEQKKLDMQWRIANLRSSGGGGGGGGRSGGGRKSGKFSAEGALLSNIQNLWGNLSNEEKSASTGNTQKPSQGTSQPSVTVQKPSVSANENKGSNAGGSDSTVLADSNASKPSDVSVGPLFSKDTFARRAAALMGEDSPSFTSKPSTDVSIPFKTDSPALSEEQSKIEANRALDFTPSRQKLPDFELRSSFMDKPRTDVSIPFETNTPALSNALSKEDQKAKIDSEIADYASSQAPRMPDFGVPTSGTETTRISPITALPVYTPMDEDQLRQDRAHFLENNGLLENNRTYRIDGRDVSSGSVAGVNQQINDFSQLSRQEQLEQLSKNGSGRSANDLRKELDRLAFPSKEETPSSVLTRPANSSSSSDLPAKEAQLVQAGEPTEKDLREVGTNAKKMADTLYEIETKGGSVTGVRSGTTAINYDPTVMPSDADIFNADSSKLMNATPTVAKQLISSPVGSGFLEDLELNLIKRDSHGNVDHKTTNANIANYVGRSIVEKSKQDRYNLMKLCYYLANRPEYKNKRMGTYFKAVGEVLQDSFDINVDTGDNRYSDILTAKAYKMLGGTDKEIYKNRREAEKSLNEERTAIEKRQGLRAPGTVTSKDLDSLTGLSKLDHITRADTKKILNDPFSNPVVARYLYLKGKGKFTNRDLKIASTAYIYAMMGTWNREAEDRVFKRPDQVRRFFYDVADKTSSTHEDFKNAFLDFAEILEKGGAI
jgi:hypothetical protein